GIGPFGDQALFTTRELFQEVGGFRPGALLEDLDLVRRLRRRGRVVILPEAVETSARRWERAGFLSTTLGNLAFLGLHVLGRRGEGLTAAYRRYRLRGHAPE
ncbi:MAG: glycosyltransferase, partial [Planctomycetota bacterium]